MEKILVLDFGGQYDQLIARRVREHGVYCEVWPCTADIESIRAFHPIGLIFTGGPGSVYAPDAPDADKGVFSLGIPVLGICYGCQLMAQRLGGLVTPAQSDTAREYGKTETRFDTACALFRGLPEDSVTWMSHGDYMAKVPDGFRVIARSDACPNAAIADEKRRFYGVQFHPEVNHTEYGKEMLRNFLFDVCGASGDWTMESFRARAVRELREKIGEGKVLLALSGGVDSSVCAALLSEAVGRRLTCVFVDHGLLRLNEGDEVEAAFSGRELNFLRVDAAGRFLRRLSGVEEPERKRKIIGEEFIRVFEEESRKLGTVDYLAQGTIYPDVIESKSPKNGPSQTIKSHHNVGGLPPDLKFELVEPLKELFKDEVRAVGRVLGMADELLDRQPFPGPGLGVRILGEVTKEKVELLQLADLRVQEEIRKLPDYKTIWQTFAVLLPVKSVGVMGDQRTYEYTCAVRSVNSIDAMTADWTRIPYDVLARISNRIINEVRGINRVVYDISSKPPATIEWE